METRKTRSRMTFYVAIAVIGMLVLPHFSLPLMPAGTVKVSYGYGRLPRQPSEDRNGNDEKDDGELADYVDSNERKVARDPESPWAGIIIPKGAVHKPVKVRVYETGWSEDVTAPTMAKSVSSPFFFGAWAVQEGITVCEFDSPIAIEVSYAGKPVSESEEGRLALYMYDPVSRIWVKLHSVVDPYRNVVAGWVRYLKRVGLDKGNTLLALFVHEPYSLEQTVDSKGVTTISWAEKGVSLHVPPGTVDVGSFFDMTSFSSDDVPPAGSPLKLGSTIVHVQAWNDTGGEMNNFSKSIAIEVGCPLEDLAEAESKANLTIVTLKDGVWIDVEDLGYKVTRGEKKLTVDTDYPGVFALAIKTLG
jgi:hypothetical protein